MKAQENFYGTQKKAYVQQKDTIQTIIFSLLVILMFTAGYLFSWNCLEKPMNTEQFEFCEQVARDVYNQKGNVIVEIPKNISVTTTATTIEVRLSDMSRGRVVAKLQNGELTMTRDLENGVAKFLSILVGLTFTLVPVVFYNKREN